MPVLYVAKGKNSMSGAISPLSLPIVDMQYLLDCLVALCGIPSPTGMTDAAMAYVEQQCAEIGIPWQRTVRGAGLATLGQAQTGPAVALAAHVDTLGAMVKEIKPSGRLLLKLIGGSSWGSVEGEYCLVHTSDGQQVSGTIVHVKSSVHIFGHEKDTETRTADTYEVRINQRTASAEETHALGIAVGDFVSFDPRTVAHPTGFITSRHLDDKACAAILLAVARALVDAGQEPEQPTYLFFSNYEEVGHGAAAGIPAAAEEVIAVDMAVVGKGQTSSEFSVTVCTLDAGGPYDHALSSHLRRLAEVYQVPCQADVYIRYSSDATAALQAGMAARAACIGPGIDASHAHERAHLDGLLATANLLLAYVCTPRAE